MDAKTTSHITESPLERDAKSSPAVVTDQGKEALKDIAVGSLAGMIGKVVEYPFDTVKVRLQSQPEHLPLRYAGPIDCFRKSMRQEGVRGLYRGVSAPLFGAAAETSCLFFSYRVSQDLLRSGLYTSKDGPVELPISLLVTAGALSGAITSLILTPIELVKCRTQVPLQSPLDPTLGARVGLSSTTLSPLAVIGDVYRSEGVAGFWRGQLGTLLRETGGSAAWFGSYESLSGYFKNRMQTLTGEREVSIPIWQQMLSGAVAGMNYNFLFYPADTIKSKMQTSELGMLHSERQTFLGVGRALWRTHGLSGLYRGCGITVARSAPSSALIFTIYESLRKAVG